MSASLPVNCLFAAFLSILPLQLLATSPQLTTVIPTGAQRGTEVEVRFGGERLQDTQELLVYEPGIEVQKLELITNNLVKARLKLSTDCPLGEHHLRLRTATGLSDVRTFLVGPFPVVAEIEPNDTPAKAQKVPLNTTVAGIIKNEDIDCFAVELQRGQRFSAEVEGMRLGRAVFDPSFSVLAPDGSTLAEVDDTWLGRQDPLVSLIAPQDGTYVIRLREVTYGGADNFHYRLHLGTFPRPTSVFPLGGQAGQTVALSFFSEATGEFTQQVKLPAAPREIYGVFAELDGLSAPSPNWIRVSDFPNVLPLSPNHDREHATATELEPPFALNGRLLAQAQQDWFCFHAKKGTPLSLSVYARRLRSPLDSVLEVFDSRGKSLASNDDAIGADSALKFTPDESTNYFVCIRDTLGQGGRDFVYRIEVTPLEPGLELKIPEVSRNDTQSRQFITVPRGNRFATLISAKRINFSGSLHVGIDDLPQGVRMEADAMPSNVDSLPVVFDATPDAPIGSRFLDFTVSGSNATGNITGKFHQDIELAQGPNNQGYYSTRLDRFCVAVTKEAPFELRVIEPKVPLVQGGSMSLEIVALRAPGFDEPIELQMVWNPPGVSSQAEATIPKGATNVFYQLSAAAGADAHLWKIAVLGHASIDGGPLYVSSQLAALEVATPFLTGKMEPLWANPGKPAKLTVTLQPAKPFDGKAAIRLLGLPDTISAPEREITSNDQEVVFDLDLATNCPPGNYKNLFCAVDVKQNGQLIPHTLAAGGILRVVAPKKHSVKLAAGENKK